MPLVTGGPAVFGAAVTAVVAWYHEPLDGGELVVSYPPASRFWTEQFIQAGLFLLVALVALGAAVWLLISWPFGGIIYVCSGREWT